MVVEGTISPSDVVLVVRGVVGASVVVVGTGTNALLQQFIYFIFWTLANEREYVYMRRVGVNFLDLYENFQYCCHNIACKETYHYVDLADLII